VQWLEPSQGYVPGMQLVASGVVDLDRLDRIVAETPHHDFGGLLRAVVLPLRSLVVEPGIPSAKNLERLLALRREVVKRPGVAELVEDHALFLGAAR